MPVNAELRRKNQAGDLVDYVLVDDPENSETALADPTVDFGARARLDAIATRLSDPLTVVQGLVPTEYDEITLTYTGDDLTGIAYRQGGTVVATLTLTYLDGRLTGVARS